jgi:hypothetical protein
MPVRNVSGMVSRRDKDDIENSGSELSESEEADEVEVLPLVRNLPNQARAGARIFGRCEQTSPRASLSAKGECQWGDMGSRSYPFLFSLGQC